MFEWTPLGLLFAAGLLLFIAIVFVYSIRKELK